MSKLTPENILYIVKIKKLLFVYLIFNATIAFSQQENDESVKCLCEGTMIVEEYHLGGKKTISRYEDSYIYTFSKDKLRKENDGYNWLMISDKHGLVTTNRVGNSNSPKGFWRGDWVQVQPDNIEVERNWGNNSPSRGIEKTENSHLIQINRVSGNWMDTIIYRTTNNDGHTKIRTYTMQGKCKRATNKF